MSMQRQFKLMILTNVVLAVFFLLSNYVIWTIVNQWGNSDVFSSWSATQVEPRFDPSHIFYPPGGMQISNIVNVPFFLFWLTIAVNIFFIYKLQRSKETKPTMPGKN